MLASMYRPTASLLVFVTLTSCVNFTALDRTPGTTTGEIFISPPSIDTRERLLSDRNEQNFWLNEQLKKDGSNNAFQGTSARRSFEGVLSQNQANFDPGLAGILRAGQANQLQALQNANALAAINAQIELVKKQGELKAMLAAAARGTPQAAAASASGSATSSASSGTSGSASGTASGSASSSGSGSASTPASDSTTAPTNPANATFASLPSLDQLTSAQEQLKKSFDLLAVAPQNSLTDTPIEQFRDRLAYREEVRNEIIANNLDDRHDVYGNTLYRLNFDSTILPADDTSAWAVISVCVQRPNEKRCTEGTKTTTDFNAVDAEILKREIIKKFDVNLIAINEEIDRWPDVSADLNGLTQASKNAILKGMRAWAKEAQPRSESPRIAAKMAARIAAFDPKNSSVKKLDLTINGLIQDAKAACTNFQMSFTNQDFSIKGKVVESQGKIGLVCDNAEDKANEAIQLRWNLLKAVAQLGLVLEVRDTLEQAKKSSEGKLVLKLGDANLDIDGNLANFITKVLKRENLEIYAYGATPKESVQRISDIVTRREAQQFQLGVQALLGNVSIASLNNFIKTNEGIFNTVRRQPLVVGFGHSGANISSNNDAEKAWGKEEFLADFGWIIGPKFGAAKDGKSVNFRHVPIQNALAAVISVPSWWDSAELVVSRQWIDERTGSIRQGSTSRKLSKITFPISLPGTPTDILNILGNDSKIVLDAFPGNKPRWLVKPGKRAEILIRGKNLWKSPQVRLGGQYATKVRVLPDMNGVVGIFEQVDEFIATTLPPADVAALQGTLPVTVTTTDGFELAGYAKVDKDEKPPAAPDPVTTGPGVFLADAENKVLLAKKLDGYFDIKMRYRQAGSGKAFALAYANIGVTGGKKLTVKLTKPLLGVKEGAGIEMQLAIIKQKGDEPEYIAVDGKLIYLRNTSTWAVKASGSFNAETGKLGLILEIPDVYEDALGIKEHKPLFVVKAPDFVGDFDDCTIKNGQCTIELKVPEKFKDGNILLAPKGLDEITPNPFKALDLKKLTPVAKDKPHHGKKQKKSGTEKPGA